MLLRQRLEAERYQQEQRKYSVEAKGEVEEHHYGMPAGELADVDNLDEYLEKLYDDMEEKVRPNWIDVVIICVCLTWSRVYMCVYVCVCLTWSCVYVYVCV
jgi:hypothetical protein